MPSREVPQQDDNRGRHCSSVLAMNGGGHRLLPGKGESVVGLGGGWGDRLLGCLPGSPAGRVI